MAKIDGVLKFYNGSAWEPFAAPATLDNTVTRTSANGVKSSGIWSAIWGALAALPAGFSSLYDWCVSQLSLKADKTYVDAKSSIKSPDGDTTVSADDSGTAKVTKTTHTLGNPTVTFQGLYTISYYDTSWSTESGITMEFVGPVPSAVPYAPNDEFYYYSVLGTLDSYDPSEYDAWCIWVSGGRKHLMYKTGPYYDIENFDSASPSLTLNQGEATGEPPVLTRTDSTSSTTKTAATTDQIPDVVAPSTSASASGKAADAKATGDALALKANDNAVVHLTGEQQTISAVLQLMSTLYAESGVESHGDYRLTWRVEGDYAGTLTISQDSISVQLANEQSARQYRFQAGGGGTVAFLQNIAPEFVYQQSYAAGELCVSYDANTNHLGYWLYKCILATDGSTTPEMDSTHWATATVEDVLAAIRTAIAGKADASAIPYSLVTKTISNGAVSLDDRAINAVAVSSSLASLTVNFPTATSGKARDFGLRLTVASGITTAPELALPQGVTCENADGEAPEIGADGAATILYFTETASGVFLVKGEVVQTIS